MRIAYSKEHFDAAISIDADLQDDIEVINKMIEKYCAGYEIVYGIHSSWKTDSFFKRSTAQGFRALCAFVVRMLYMIMLIFG